MGRTRAFIKVVADMLYNAGSDEDEEENDKEIRHKAWNSFMVSGCSLCFLLHI